MDEKKRILEVSVADITHNLNVIRKRVGPYTRILPMIKANGYGTDATHLARIYQRLGVDILGVADVNEAISLREQGIKSSLLICQSSIDEYPEAIKVRAEVTVTDKEQVSTLNTLSQSYGHSTAVHLKINSGMNRYGCQPEQALSLAQQISSASHLKLAGLMTHLATADDPHEDQFTSEQINCFNLCISSLKKANITPQWYHAANSAGIFRHNFSKCNMVRPGGACLGASSIALCPEGDELRQALTLWTRITSINECRYGDSISYGRKYRVKQPCARIATFSMGYADGIPWHCSNRGYVLIRGHSAPLVGSICMDTTLADVSDIPDVAVGDRVTILGRSPEGPCISLSELANIWKTHPYQIMVGFGHRIHRQFIYEDIDDQKCKD